MQYKFTLSYGEYTDILSNEEYTYKWTGTGGIQKERQCKLPMFFDTVEQAIEFRSNPDVSKLYSNDSIIKDELPNCYIRVVEEDELKEYGLFEEYARCSDCVKENAEICGCER